MWTWLGRLITFNFVNIAWIFFRAKEWDDAVKVLEGMFGINGVVLSDKYSEKLVFLISFNISFGSWLSNIGAKNNMIIWIFITFIILSMKNTTERIQKFNPDFKMLIFTSFLILWPLLILNKISEFLYFNF